MPHEIRELVRHQEGEHYSSTRADLVGLGDSDEPEFMAAMGTLSTMGRMTPKASTWSTCKPSFERANPTYAKENMFESYAHR
jgi:hypothetical protein